MIAKRPLHKIDQKRDNWSDRDLDRFMVFCILDRATSYGIVCDAFDALDKENLTTREGLKEQFNPELKDKIQSILQSVGYRFPEQGANNVTSFMINGIDLRETSREGLVESISGVGYKLASMFVRNTRGDDIAVIDTHIKKWLKEQGCEAKNYIEQERFFLNHCKEKGLDVYEFDMSLWEDRRR